MPQAKALSWDEVDCILSGYDHRVQTQLYGHRLTAHLVYNFMAEKPLTAGQFLPLPRFDAAHSPVAAAPDAAFLERIAQRLGHPITLVTD